VPLVSAGEIELHYEERGAGRPLLLVPGIPAIASDWAPLAERLDGSRRTIAYDNRGSGASTVTPAPYTTAQLAADAVPLLDTLETVAGAGHLFFLERPEATQRLLEAFLR
jgi:pimeloyl-ACP methyl ester carboxylesterase